MGINEKNRLATVWDENKADIGGVTSTISEVDEYELQFALYRE